MNWKAGDLVAGPFYSDGHTGVGVIRDQKHAVWSRYVDGQYVPVEVLVGDRINGGYLTTGLRKLGRFSR